MSAGRRLLFGVLLAVTLAVPAFVDAQEGAEAPPIIFTPQVPIPGTPGFAGAHPITENTLGEYFQALYVYFISAVGVIAVTMIMYGGFRWITAAGNPSRIQAAQETINSALIGLVLALTSFLILNTINPNLVRFRIPVLSVIETQFQTNSPFCDQVASSATPGLASTPCGEEARYTDAAGNVKVCLGSFVNPDVGLAGDGTHTKDALICAWNKKRNKYVAAPAKDVCQSGDYASRNECPAADERIARVQNPGAPPGKESGVYEGGNELACRKLRARGSRDSCQLKAIFTCPSALSTRVNCNVAGGIDTPCWEDGAPATWALSQIRCVDAGVRAATGVDAICCMRTEDASGVQCDAEQPGFQTLGDKSWVEADQSRCDKFGKTCSGREKCWVKLDLLTSPF